MKTYLKFAVIILLMIGSTAQAQITTGTINGSPFCPGGAVAVPYTATGTFNSNNVFRAQLSNASGSFYSPVVIGTITTTTSGTINATIPANTVAGTGYRIRVISTNPALTGTANTVNLTVLATASCGTSWTTTGNGGITRNNFIGTLTDTPLVFRVANIRSGIIDKLNFNASIGYQTLASNTFGILNTAVGNAALSANTAGSNNTAIGAGALTSNTTSGENTATGAFALNANTSEQNTAHGSSALRFNGIGFRNNAMGFAALYYNTDGMENTAFGALSMYYTTTGNYNTGCGNYALFNNTTGILNSAVGIYALQGNTTGSRNTAVGDNSLYSNSSGGNNTAVGHSANVSTGTLTNATVIGSSASVNASNKVRLGNSSITVVEGQVAYSFPSDGRFKTNVKENAPGLDLIMKLKPVTYNFQYGKFSEFLKEKDPDTEILAQREKKTEFGFIAQEVEQVCKELGVEVSNLVHVPESDYDNYSMAYQNLVVPLVKAVQEQQKIIEEQKKTTDERIAALEARIEALMNGQGKSDADRNSSARRAELGQNIPNPFDKSTIIPLSIPADCSTASLVISHAGTGQVVKTIPVNCKDTQVALDAGSLQAGSYSYSLVVNGTAVDTKKMVIAK